jgi:hypothetical protein
MVTLPGVDHTNVVFEPTSLKILTTETLSLFNALIDTKQEE